MQMQSSSKLWKQVAGFGRSDKQMKQLGDRKHLLSKALRKKRLQGAWSCVEARVTLSCLGFVWAAAFNLYLSVWLLLELSFDHLGWVYFGLFECWGCKNSSEHWTGIQQSCQFLGTSTSSWEMFRNVIFSLDMQMLLALLALLALFEPSFTEKTVPIVGGHPEHVRIVRLPGFRWSGALVAFEGLQDLNDILILTYFNIFKMIYSFKLPNIIQSNLRSRIMFLEVWVELTSLSLSLSHAKRREKVVEPSNQWWRLTYCNGVHTNWCWGQKH